MIGCNETVEEMNGTYSILYTTRNKNMKPDAVVVEL